MLRPSPLLVSFVFLSGCVTMGSVRRAPPEAGFQCTYAGAPQAIKQAALEALGEAGFQTAESVNQEPSGWRVIATQESANGKTHIARVMGESKESESLIRILVQTKGSGEAAEPGDAELAQSIHERLARKLGRSAPAPGSAPGKTVNVGIEKKCSSDLAVCFDAALQTLRDRDYRILDHARPSGESGKIVAQGKGFSITVTLERPAGNRTRVVIQVDGRGEQENRDEELSLLDQLRKKLLEPLD
jgi:hypothetical protein